MGNVLLAAAAIINCVDSGSRAILCRRSGGDQLDTVMRIQVECYAGHRGEETPRRLQIGDRFLEVVVILDRWLAPEHRYFKFKTAEGAQWIIRHDTLADQWELIHFKQALFQP